jgi:predicted SnoaL-like aldol condensation-catalyzing enzyme
MRSIRQTTTTRTDIAMSFLELASSGQVDRAFGDHVTEDFRHHDPYVPGETESLSKAMKQNADEHPDKVFEVQRALEDGDLVAVHSRVRLDPGGPDAAVVHIFRFENYRIAELWDVAAPVPDGSPNQNGAF